MNRFRCLLLLLVSLLFTGCLPVQTTIVNPPAPPSSTEAKPAVTDDMQKTLASLRQVDDHPLFTMTYYGAYDLNLPETPVASQTTPGWACSLFVTFADPAQPIFARNFDWQQAPALLLFTDPPDGYASVSMVDISYLGYDENSLDKLQSLEGKQDLLYAPRIPFDGMNEYGLAVGMAAVDPTAVPNDPQKPTIGSLRIIRLMLDRAKTVEEALTVFQQYNLDFSGGPPIHYLVADQAGESAVIEYKAGELRITRGGPWQVATNFYLADSTLAQRSTDHRYNRLDTALTATAGKANLSEAMTLLADVAQHHTRWSIVYGMKSGAVWLATSKRYETIHTFELPMAQPENE